MIIIPAFTIIGVVISVSSAEPFVLVLNVTSYGDSASPTNTVNIALNPSSTAAFSIIICGLATAGGTSATGGGVGGVGGNLFGSGIVTGGIVWICTI